MPHNNSRDNPGFLNDPCTLPVTDFPAGAFTALGLNYLVGYLPRFGFTRPFQKNLSIALGSAEVSLLELTRGYTVFANQGRRVDPIFITKITDPHGTVLEEFKPTSKPVISPETAYLVTSMLESVITRGT